MKNFLITSSLIFISFLTYSSVLPQLKAFGGPNYCYGETTNVYVDNATSCAYYSWTVTNGKIIKVGTTTVSPRTSTGYVTADFIEVEWNTPDNGSNGKVNLATIECGNSWESTVISKTFILKSIKIGLEGISPVEDQLIPYGDNSPRTFSLVTQHYYKNTDPGVYITNYKWEIPPGWQFVGRNDLPTIQVIPDYCTGGFVTVKAKSECGEFYSTQTVRKVSRFKPIIRIIEQDENIAVCGRTSPFIMSATHINGATYSWSLPSGWQSSGNNSTTTITPNGQNGGEVNVTASYCGKTSTALPIDFPFYYSDPDPSKKPFISGDKLVCSNATDVTYTVNYVESGWTYSWTKGSVLSYVSGQGTKNYKIESNNPVDDQSWVDVTINTGCNNQTIDVNKKDIWVGKPNYNNLILWVDNDELSNCDYTYAEADYSSISMGILEYKWDIPYSSDWYIDEEYGSPADWQYVEIDYFDQYPPNEEAIRLKARNTCGWSLWREFWVDVDDCAGGWYYSYAFSPNPVEETLSVSFNNEKENNSVNKLKSATSESTKVVGAPVEIAIFNKDQVRVIYKKGSTENNIEIDVSSIASGSYFIHVSIDGKKTDRKHLIIK